MLDCCTNGTDKFFSKQAKRYARKFRRKGLDKVQSLLAYGLKKRGVDSCSILEIGCGVGGLHQVLLKEGASSATGVDIAHGMLEQAKILAREQGLEGRTEYVAGDIVRLDGEIPNADVVILDKVICCYSDPETLLRKSMDKCGTSLALSYPGSGLIARLVFKSGARVGELLNWSFHPFYHDPLFIEEAIRRGGFDEVYTAATITWQIRVFEKGN